MDPFLGLRRPAELQPGPARESDPRLVARIRAEIDAGGPITFARFMEIALYDPVAGYYTGEQARPGRDGDFITSPEAHPIFGWALARQLVQLWELLDRPMPLTIREHGPGTGSLIVAILQGLKQERPDVLSSLRYQPVEVASVRLQELTARLVAAGHESVLAPADDGPRAGSPARLTGLVLANEVLDALPVHRVRGSPGGGLEELYVTSGSTGFEPVAGPPSGPALADRLAAEDVVLQPGQEAEICLALDGWIALRAAELERGLLLLIDYGHRAPELYDPRRRPHGTLLGYQRHQAMGSPFTSVGRQDLTAHVDVTAVERAAVVAGLAHLGTTTQAELLTSLDAGALLAGLRDRPETGAAAYLEARMALVRMLDPAAMGRFRVMAFGRGLPPETPLRAFAFRLPGA